MERYLLYCLIAGTEKPVRTGSIILLTPQTGITNAYIAPKIGTTWYISGDGTENDLTRITQAELQILGLDTEPYIFQIELE